MSRFENACSASADAADDAPPHEPPDNEPFARDDAIAVADDNDFASHLSACVRHVFGVPSLRPRQVEEATKIIFEKKCRCRLLVVDRTEGGGKSLILHTVAVCVGGVSLVLVSLLALMADQLSRIQSASQRHGLVWVVHLDEVPDSLVRSSLLPKMTALDKGGADTLLLYCSP